MQPIRVHMLLWTLLQLLYSTYSSYTYEYSTSAKPLSCHMHMYVANYRPLRLQAYKIADENGTGNETRLIQLIWNWKKVIKWLHLHGNQKLRLLPRRQTRPSTSSCIL